MMNRRDFLAAASAFAAGSLAPRCNWAGEIPPDITITRAIAFDLPTRRNKVAGKNSHLDVHGDRSADRMVRLYTSAGIEGIGNCRAERRELRRLLGKSLRDV